MIHAHRKSQGLLISKGTMVDATLIHAPSSTKNRERARDPEMHQTKKGKQWYLYMLVQTWLQGRCTRLITAANEADISVLSKLHRVDEECCPGEYANGWPICTAAQTTVGYFRNNLLKMPQWQTMKYKRGDLAVKRCQKMNCRESLFKKLTVMPKNLKVANCSAFP